MTDGVGYPAPFGANPVWSSYLSADPILITYLLEWDFSPSLRVWKAVVFWALCCADSRTSDDRAETWKQCNVRRAKKNAG